MEAHLMALDTYAELLGGIEDWLNRVGSPELAVRAPDFVRLAEARFNRDLRVRQMLTRARDLYTVDGAFDLPSDWLETKKVTVVWGGKIRKLEPVSEDQADKINERNSYLGTGPTAYTVNGSLVELLPTPTDDLDVYLDYYAEVPALSESNTSNWLLARWPDMYLYGSLVHSAPYLRDDSRVTTWAGFYDRALGEIRAADERAAFSGTGLRTRARLRN
jgi:hypothetical protein